MVNALQLFFAANLCDAHRSEFEGALSPTFFAQSGQSVVGARSNDVTGHTISKGQEKTDRAKRT